MYVNWRAVRRWERSRAGTVDSVLEEKKKMSREKHAVMSHFKPFLNLEMYVRRMACTFLWILCKREQDPCTASFVLHPFLECLQLAQCTHFLLDRRTQYNIFRIDLARSWENVAGETDWDEAFVSILPACMKLFSILPKIESFVGFHNVKKHASIRIVRT